ncbi:MFS family permease [Pullulanibacillus pueri]|uniref:MFS transporter n=1 Tax=Pullulanibacillus pueri TaxID=1437324 RepID=A0A8J2ZZU7_9BACL|nr:MFS transporter [Pullulanibacillus pueri]MBM7684165.1 MFS family permease [Pullulanibacillus pueri]GGH88847.1 MFS transporter [Pullulanibacillus pueri]
MIILKNKTFMLLLGGQGISIFGDSLYSVALMWYIMDQTGSTLSLGMSVICMTLPSILFMPWAGVLADKNIKKTLLFASDGLNGLLMCLLMVITLIKSEGVPTVVIDSCLMLTSTIRAFFSPALSATIPLIVEEKDLTRANSAFQFIRQFSNIAGPAVGGLLMAFLSISTLFMINAFSFFIAAVFSLFMSIPNLEALTVKQPFFKRFAEGIHYTFRMRRLLFLILVGGVIINFFLAPLNIFTTYLCNQVLETGAQGLGWVEASISIGAVLGSCMMMSGWFKNQIRLAVFGLCLEGIALLIAGIFMEYWALILFASLLGFGVCLASVGISTTYQKLIAPDKMGRVMSFSSMISSCTVPVGMLAGTFAVAHWDMSFIFLISGLVVFISGLALVIPFKGEFKSKQKTVALGK